MMGRLHLWSSSDLKHRYGNQCIGRAGRIAWPPTSPDLTPLDLFIWELIKEIVHKTKVRTGVKLLRRIMNASAYILEHSETMQRVVNSSLKRARLCIENRGRRFEQLT
jgi:hypothetical protein